MLRGFDQFMNIVLDNAVDEKNKTDIGMVVRQASQVSLGFASGRYALHLLSQKSQPLLEPVWLLWQLKRAVLSCMYRS